jgi:hypothetical protein
MSRLRLAIAVFAILSTGASRLCADVFQIKVVDSQTGRGVPLVELQPTGGPKLITDSNGIVALDDPALLNKNVPFGLQSYGYSDWGQTVQTTAGGSVQIAIDRRNAAERLYRVTGPGIYADSVEVGVEAPIANPLHNANVKGQDSVQATVYKNQIYWFWGDTLYEVGFGNFRTAGARSQLSSQGGLDPSVGVNLNYFVNASGSARQMMPLSDPGPVWIDGLFTVKDDAGAERMLTHYSRMNSDPAHAFEVLEHGLALYSDATDSFLRHRIYSATAPIAPRGHAFRQTVDGQEYIYFAEDYPNVRVKADWNSVNDISQWEAYTPLQANTRFNASAPPLETDGAGNVIFGWKKNADPLTSDMVNGLVQQGHLERDESPFRLEDHATGRAIRLHRASVHWNDYRQNFVMIGTESFGDSFLGEVWFSEAPTPEGPWADAIKVATHDRGASGDYTFYNPTSHPFFDQEGGRFIYFEGTYANTFSGNNSPTPVYDYNQMMYRLDLSTIPALTRLGGDYDEDGDVDGDDFMLWQRSLGAVVPSGTGADGDGNGRVERADLAPWKLRFGRSATSGGASAAVPEPATATFWALAVVVALHSARRPRLTCPEE